MLFSPVRPPTVLLFLAKSTFGLFLACTLIFWSQRSLATSTDENSDLSQLETALQALEAEVLDDPDAAVTRAATLAAAAMFLVVLMDGLRGGMQSLCPTVPM